MSSWCLWCFWAFVVEALLYLFYRSHAPRFHWMVHFLVGASMALILMTLRVLRAHSPVHLPLVWIGVAHLFAMAPDVLFVVGIAHERWRDVFLGPVSSRWPRICWSSIAAPGLRQEVPERGVCVDDATCGGWQAVVWEKTCP